jgi:hypothetical protein
LHPSGLPFLYAGKLDQVGLFNGQIPVVLDDKTTAKFLGESVWIAGIRTRAQFIGYVWAMQKLVDPACDSVVVRQTAIYKEAVDHRESPMISYPRHVVQSWLETTRDTVRRIVAADKLGSWPAVLSDACVSWYRPCSYLEPCMAKEPEAHFDSFDVRRWNPLSEPQGDAA